MRLSLPDGANGVDVSLTLRLDADDALFVVVGGKRPMLPVIGGDGDQTLRWAMTGALWVDADGDGRALGR